MAGRDGGSAAAVVVAPLHEHALALTGHGGGGDARELLVAEGNVMRGREEEHLHAHDEVRERPHVPVRRTAVVDAAVVACVLFHCLFVCGL